MRTTHFNGHAPMRRGPIRLGLLGALVVSLLCTACSNDGPKMASTTASSVGQPLTTASISPVSKTELSTLPSETSATVNALGSLSSAGGRPLKIGLLLPLGGFDQTAAIAKGMKQAAEMALFESERQGVQLIVKDDKGTADGARAAADEAIKEGAEIILGPLFGRAVAGAAVSARAANVPVVSFSNDRQVAGGGVYVIGFAPEQDVARVIGYAASQNKKRFAALIPDDGYGQIVGAAFREAVAVAGGTVAAVETYPAGANAMLGPSRRIVAAVKTSEEAGSPVDAVFVPGGQDVLPQLGPLMAYSGFDSGKVKLLGSGAWEFANIGNNDMFVGGWYPGPDPQGWRAFTGRFVKTYSQPPPRLASVAYDAVRIAISLGSEDAGRRFTQANLMRPSGFAGIDGTIRFTGSGIAERSLAVLEVQKIGSIVVEPGPGSLDGAKTSDAAPGRVN
jgi:branched-chain amino acid transport system substrate-binding protein